MKKILILLLVFLVAACVARGPIKEDRRHTIKDIGVVSLLGNEFYGIHLAPFDNRYYAVDVKDWQIDKYVEETISRKLVESKKYSNVAAIPNGVRYVKFEEKKSLYQDKVDIEGLISEAKKLNIDTLLIVRRNRYDNAARFLRGYGFAKAVAMSTTHCTYALYIIEAYDVLTGKPMAWEWGLPVGEVCTPVDGNLTWKDSYSDFSEEEWLLIRNNLKSTLDKGIHNALYSLWLLHREKEKAEDDSVF